ncbi:MAG TPA: 50S ribosomal protein L21 [Candidatus Dormibacteraeota bacterium]|nr:50S ribosomal protein L21 [Candidatus Dormibacteraeota bacterium]
MYAIVQQGGHQYRLAPGDRFLVDRMAAEVGSMIALEPVLLLGDADGAGPGLDAAQGARVAAVVVGHRLGRKLRVYKYKPKKRYRRTQGHRSRYTELRVEALLTAGQPLPAREKTAAPAPRRAAAPNAPQAAEPRAAGADVAAGDTED